MGSVVVMPNCTKEVRRPRMAAEGGVSCDHVYALFTFLPQTPGVAGTQNGDWDARGSPVQDDVCVVSLDVNTAF